jgi:stage V sporulation protein AE
LGKPFQKVSPRKKTHPHKKLNRGNKMAMILPYLRAFIVGGVFCIIAQILIDRTKLTPARILVVYVVAGVILGGIGLYKPIVDFAGAGATTPLTGFGYLISKGIKKAVDEKGLLGALTGGLTSAAGGIAAALTFGYLACLLFKGKSKS